MSITGAFIVPHPPLIMPQVGRGEEKIISLTTDSYREAARRIAALKPETIVVTSPHATMYSNYFHVSPGEKAHGDLRRFGAPGVSVQALYDTEFVQTLEELSRGMGIPAGTRGEREKALDHGTLLPLAFINEFYSGYMLVRIGLSGLPPLDHYRLGKCIAETADTLGRSVVFVASGDLSHKLKADGPYGYAPEGPEFDRQVTAAMASGDFLRFLEFEPNFCDAAAECGLRSFIIMAGALDGKAVAPDFLSYEDVTGVGYGVCAFSVPGDDPGRQFDKIYEKKERDKVLNARANQDEYVKLARFSLETYVRTGKFAELPGGLPEEMTKKRAGVFVSLKKHGQLRGCIGTISPVTGSIAEEILRNAVSAGAEDPRFSPVEESELGDLIYSVDVLSDPEPVDSVSQLDPVRYGVIVTSGRRRGLLLPNLEGVDTPEQQVDIAMRKAGISKGEKISLERFEVVRHV